MLNGDASPSIHFYSSSGGNAGLGCVHAAVTLGYPATIVIPLSTTSFMKERLLAAGATNVIQQGESWAEADKYLREVVMVNAAQSSGRRETPVYVPPFDAQEIWDGNATIVEELLRQLQGMDKHYRLNSKERNEKTESYTMEGNTDAFRVLPDVIICSVGGGGLLNGICQGIDKAGLSSTVKVIGMETLGAASLTQAIQKKELVTLPEITSIATSLGARTVSSKALEYGLRDMVTTQVVADAAAVEACRRIAEEQRLLVEPACGVCVAPIYDRTLNELVPNLKPESNVVVVMCGGSNISMEILADYVKKYGNIKEEA